MESEKREKLARDDHLRRRRHETARTRRHVQGGVCCASGVNETEDGVQLRLWCDGCCWPACLLVGCCWCCCRGGCVGCCCSSRGAELSHPRSERRKLAARILSCSLLRSARRSEYSVKPLQDRNAGRLSIHIFFYIIVYSNICGLLYLVYVFYICGLVYAPERFACTYAMLKLCEMLMPR